MLVQFLPPNTSHFLQPLDDKIFAIYKSKLAQLARRLADALASKNQRATALEIITAVSASAVAAAFSPAKIAESFSNCNIWPYRKEKIRESSLINIGEVLISKKETAAPIKRGGYDSKALQQKAALALIAKKKRMEETISQFKDTKKVRSMVVKYGVLSSTEKVELESQRLAQEKEEKVEESRIAAQEKMIEKEIKLRKKEDDLADKEKKKKEKEAEAELKKKEAEKKKSEKLAEEAKRRKDSFGKKRKRGENDDDIEHMCVSRGCPEIWDGLAAWQWCAHCQVHGYCLAHWEAGQEDMVDHEERACPRRPKKQKIRD